MENKEAYCVRVGKDHMLGTHYRVFLNVNPTGRMVDFYIDDNGNKSSVLLWGNSGTGKFSVQSTDEKITERDSYQTALDFQDANKLFYKYMNDNFSKLS